MAGQTISQYLLKSQKKRAKIIEWIFVASFFVIPIINLIVFWLRTNLISLQLVFQEMDDMQNASWVGWANFEWFFKQLFEKDSDILNGLLISLLDYALGWVTFPITMMIAFWVYKREPGTHAFRILSMLPSCVSGVLLGSMFLKFANNMTYLMKFFGIDNFPQLLMDRRTRFAMTMYYGIWQAYGMSTILYSNAMNRVDKEIIESAQLDGITTWKEFWLILFPMIFSTWSMGVVIGFSNILTDSGPLYLFWEFNAPRDTIRLGYLTYRMTMVNGPVDYPRVAVINLVGTAIVYPLTMLVKRWLEKVDPLAD